MGISTQTAGLQLPESANDLLIRDSKLLMRSLSIYEVLRRFGHILQLTPFRYEDFSAAILAEEQSPLIAEIHIQLLRTLIREDRQQQTWLGSPDIRDAVNIYLYNADHVTWPAALKLYLSADPIDNAELLDELYDDKTKNYPHQTDLATRICILEQLCDRFLLSNLARDEIVNGNTSATKTETTCRSCSKSNGDLINCANCPATYHLRCLNPPLDDYPDVENGDEAYLCALCRSNHVIGVSDCVNTDINGFNSKRLESFGMDKTGRTYWFIVRRLFVVDETEDDVRYYTFKQQFSDVLDYLRDHKHDKALLGNLKDSSEEITRQMSITDDLYESNLKNFKNEDGSYTQQLGQDGIHKLYNNHYSSNASTNSKTQHSDRDVLRSLGNKFSINSMNSFRYSGAIHGHYNQLLMLLRSLVLRFETNLPHTFIHPCWRSQRVRWIKTINNAQEAEEFANCLSLLEASIRPILFRSAWYESVGFTHLCKSTQAEREELKKTDRQPRGFERCKAATLDFDNSVRIGTMVKFCNKLKPVKHQVWKQKGEEYRLTGMNGWYWRSKTHQSRCVSASKLPKREPHKWPSPKEPTENNETAESTEATNKPVKIVRKTTILMPPAHDFLSKRGRILSILVLPDRELRRLSRSGGLREAPSFSYTAKQSHFVWPYGMTPRPTFRTCWLYRNKQIDTLQDVALQLKVLHASLRWDDLQVRPPPSGHNTITTDDSTVTVEVLKKRDRLPYLLHSEYLIRKTVTPIEQPNKYRKNSIKKSTPSSRTGLRARRQVEEEEEKGPTTEEVWVAEHQLELWEVKQFDEKIERQNQLLRERAMREEAERKRKIEEEKRRRVEQERRKRNEEEAKRVRLSKPGTPQTALLNAPMTPQGIRVNGPNQANTPTTPVVRYFRTEQGQIIRLPASYLQTGTPLILRHVSPGTGQTNTYIIRPQATTSISPAVAAVAPSTPDAANRKSVGTKDDEVAHDRHAPLAAQAGPATAAKVGAPLADDAVAATVAALVDAVVVEAAKRVETTAAAATTTTTTQAAVETVSAAAAAAAAPVAPATNTATATEPSTAI